MPDPVEIAQELIRSASVTPDASGALDIVERHLTAAGFTCTRLPFTQEGTPDVDNLYARIGSGEPHFCFAGHADVVPPGDESLWAHPPFAGVIDSGVLYGRGAVDMKGAIACFIAAADNWIRDNGDNHPGSISLLITGDEEGPAINGTKKMLEWANENNEIPDHCLVGEPSNPSRLGETIKTGRRGSLSCRVKVSGIEGHAAYPHLADNPVHKIINMLHSITAGPLDEGSEFFEPSSVQITGIDCGNEAVNIIPGQISARFNIRFNEHHSGDGLKKWLRAKFSAISDDFALEFEPVSDVFRTEPGPFIDVITNAVTDITGLVPELGTGGGTSDARFIKNYCPVAEFGLTGATMHKTGECVGVDELKKLTEIYTTVLNNYFATFPGNN